MALWLGLPSNPEPTFPIHSEDGWVQGNLGALVYGLHAPRSRRVLLRHGWTLALLWSRGSHGCRLMSLKPLTLGNEGTLSLALTSGPRSLAPLEPMKLFFLFFHAIYVTMSREWPIAPHAH